MLLFCGCEHVFFFFLILVVLQEDGKEETHFHIAISCIAQSLKTQIINRSYDEVAICFFNTVSLFICFWL